MRRLLFLIPLVLLVACDNPVEPSSIEEHNPINITIINNVDGDDGCQINCGKDDVDPDPDVPANSAPILIMPPTQTNVPGDSAFVDIAASDADGDSVDIDFEEQSAPRDCTIGATGSNSARISCVISSSSPNDSPFTVRVMGDDGNGGRATGFFVWIVNEPAEEL